MSNDVQVNENGKYHRIANWRIALFSLNNTATNLYLFAFNFLSFYAVGYLGLAMSLFGTVSLFVRLFDGIIDPTVGIIIDKIDTKWGRFRPIMIIANIGLIISFLFMFNLHHIENFTLRMVAFVFVLLFHKIVYSFQQTVTKAAQAVLTNDPEQRPMFSVFDNIFSSILVFTLGGTFISNYLQPKHGEIALPFFQELNTIVIVVSAISTILAVIALSPKDKPEYYASIQSGEERESLKDVWDIIKSNRPLQILALAAGLMKFIVQIMGDQVLLMLLFGVVLGNYGILGQLAIVSSVVSFIAIPIMSKLAGQRGLKWSYSVSVVVALVGFIGMAIVMIAPSHPYNIFENGIGALAIFFSVFYVLAKVFTQYPASLSLTMSADITDYELAESGRFASGLIGTVFSLTDSIASSLAPFISSVIASSIGYVTTTPQVGDPVNRVTFLGTLMAFVVLPAVLLLIIGVLIRLYPLSKEKMVEVQAKVEERKAKGNVVAE